jgi:hypothetical protein
MVTLSGSMSLNTSQLSRKYCAELPGTVADALAADLRRLGDLRAAARHQPDLGRRGVDRGEDLQVAMRAHCRSRRAVRRPSPTSTRPSASHW